MEPPYKESLTPDEHSGPLVVSRWALTGHAVRNARYELRDALREWKLDDLADSAELVLSELMTNALRHARLPRGRLVETRYERMAGCVRIEVHDAHEGIPRLREAADDDEGGRGLALVDALTEQRWGVSSRDGVGKRVWALVG
jgi:anti-sigma regulatory factor (Ser/Thr protein kinase)